MCPRCPVPFVLVMGSKNNNGKFDFKAAGPRWTAFRKQKSPAGLSYDLDLNGVTELRGGGDKASAARNHLSSGQKRTFCPEEQPLCYLRFDFFFPFF